jgi:hypothetical protein
MPLQSALAALAALIILIAPPIPVRAAYSPPDAAATATATAGASTPGAPLSAPAYRMSATVALGAPDRWDYLAWDPDSHRVFAAHDSTVTVVDAERSAVVGQVPVPGANGIGIASALHKGYAGSSETRSVVVFDLVSLRVLTRVPADEDTDAVVYDAANERIFVMQGDPKSATVIDARSDKSLGRIDLGGKPEFAAADGSGKLYVNLVDQGAVRRIDTRSLRADATWPLPGCERPHGLALDTSARRLFSGCVNQRLLVLDLDDGHVVAKLPIGAGSDAVGFDPRLRHILSSNGAGTLSVIREISPDRYLPLPAVPTEPSARTLTLDPRSGTVFLLAGERVDRDPAATDPHKRYGTRPGSVHILVERPSETADASADR